MYTKISSPVHDFQRAAVSYSKYSVVQNWVGNRLIDLLSLFSPHTIVDAGCGPASTTIQLCNRFPSAKIIAFDAADSMIQMAEEQAGVSTIQFEVGDAHTWQMPLGVDMLISNALLQWCQTPVSILCRWISQLVPSSPWAVSVFCPGTFQELQWVVANVLNNKAGQLPAQQFCDGSHYTNGLSEHGIQASFHQHVITQPFADLYALLNSIRQTGTRGGNRMNQRITPRLFKQMEAAYIQKFGSIVATYRVLIIHGVSV